jgi:hypothetical protein
VSAGRNGGGGSAAAQWGLVSSGIDIALQPAHQQIIGMGNEAIPLILDELQREEDHWFWALNAITGDVPVA